MESIVEGYVVMIRNLLEESEEKYAFDHDLQSIQEQFDDNIDECDKKLDKNCLSSSRFLLEGVKEELSRFAISETQLCLKEIAKHVEWAVGQRKQIQANANKRLISEYSSLISDFFEREVRGQFLKVNHLHTIFMEGDKATGHSKVVNDFREELTKGVEPAKILFRKEIQNVSRELRLPEDSIQAKLNALSKQSKLSDIYLASESVIKGRQTNSKFFTTLFENLNKIIEKLLNDERELNNRTRLNLETNLEQNHAMINGMFDKFHRNHRKFSLEAADQKAEFDKEIDAHEEKCRKQIRLLIHDLEKERTTFNFNDLALKVLNSKLESDLEDAWFTFFGQTKSHTQSQLLNFEIGYLQLISLQRELECRAEQSLSGILKPFAEKSSAVSRKPAPHKTESDPDKKGVSTQYEEASLSHF